MGSKWSQDGLTFLHANIEKACNHLQCPHVCTTVRTTSGEQPATDTQSDTEQVSALYLVLHHEHTYAIYPTSCNSPSGKQRQTGKAYN